MEMTNEFVQLFVNKLQDEMAELNKQKFFLTTQVEYLVGQLENLKTIVQSLANERDELVQKDETHTEPVEDKPELLMEHEELKKEWANLIHTESDNYVPVKTLPLTG